LLPQGFPPRPLLDALSKGQDGANRKQERSASPVITGLRTAAPQSGVLVTRICLKIAHLPAGAVAD
jgi:hypothetical protein